MHPRDPSRRDTRVAIVLALTLAAVGIVRAGEPGTGPLAPGGPSGPRERATPFTPLLFGPGLDPSVAGPDVWEAIPGIGPTRARAIVDAGRREAFCVMEDLLRVPGLGPKTLARLRPWIAPRPWQHRCEEAHEEGLP